MLGVVAMSAEFTDPRLVAIYDALNAYWPGTQPDFYRGLARDVDAVTVVEIGCGTGLVSIELARDGFTVIGLDPSERMLEVARHRPDGDRVQWILGEVSALDVRGVDMAFMAGHVAQFFVTDEAWQEVVMATCAMLRPGGVFAFESRNPAARAWESWTPLETRRSVAHPAVGAVEIWTAVESVEGAVVTTVTQYRFAESGDELTDRTVLRFRSVDELEASLTAGGFAIEHRFGAWNRRPFSDDDEEIILVARRN